MLFGVLVATQSNTEVGSTSVFRRRFSRRTPASLTVDQRRLMAGETGADE